MKKIVLASMLALAAAVPGFATDRPMKDGGALAKDDQGFITQAALTDMTEIEVAKLARDRAAGSDVKTFAEHMIEDHTKSSGELKTLASSKGATVPDMLDARHKAMVDKLGKAKQDKFDDAYMDLNVKAHKQAIGLFEKEAKNSKDSDLRAFAEQTLPTLRSHLEMAKGLDKKKDHSHGKP